MASLTAEIPDALKMDLDVACAQRGVVKKDAVAEALAAWITPAGQEQEDPLLAKTRAILGGLDTLAKDTIQKNIEFFFDRMDRHDRHKRKAL